MYIHIYIYICIYIYIYTYIYIYIFIVIISIRDTINLINTLHFSIWLFFAYGCCMKSLTQCDCDSFKHKHPDFCVNSYRYIYTVIGIYIYIR